MPPQRRVLVVEDDAELVSALTAVLSRTYSVEVVGDAPAALKAVAHKAFDLILLDLILPKGTGFQVLAELLGRSPSGPPVVVMSALGREVDISPFQSIVAGYLIKPFGLEAMEKMVTEAIGGQRQETAGTSAASASVFLVDDDAEFAEGMAQYLRRRGYSVRVATATDDALQTLTRERFDVVVTDWIMPGINGIDLLGRIKSVAPNIPVLLLTGYGTPDMTRHAISAGAADVLVKPFPPQALPVALEKCRAQASYVASPKAMVRPERRGERGPAARAGAEAIVGSSPAIQRALQGLSRAAVLDSPVLIQGDTGTGKELFARALHELSPRADGPFVAINAAAIPDSLLESELFGYAAGAFTGARKEGQKGKFLQADGGTLFLDEIGDLPLSLQVKLLRVLQEGEVDLVGGGGKRVDVRVVTATHRNLDEMVEQESFRRDLYYRLNVVTLHLPPLRERKEDIPVLAERFLAELSARYQRPGVRLSAEVLDLLQGHDWPGNIRELRNVVERAFAFCGDDLILPVHMPVTLQRSRQSPPPTVAPAAAAAGSRDLASREQEAILEALRETGGNKLQTAKLLGISRAGLYVKLKVYGIL